MSEIGRQIVLRPKKKECIAETDEQRRIVARVVLQQGRQDGLIAFAQPDDHLHLYARCTRKAGSQLAQRIGSSLKQRLALPSGLEIAWNRPLNDGWHPPNLVRYIFKQVAHHGVVTDPYREASNLPDLLGLRLIGQYTALNLRRTVPRLQRADLLTWYGVRDLRPVDGPMDSIEAIETVVPATLSAAALPALQGRSAEVVMARRAAARVIGDRLDARQLGALLGVGPRGARKLREQPCDPALVQAIRFQLNLRSRISPINEAQAVFASGGSRP